MIDLSKIKVRELPKKTVKVNILGTIQEQEIVPLTGESRVKYWALDVTATPGESTRERIAIALEAGAGLNASDVFQLVNLDWRAAVDLAGEIHKFTGEFEDALKSEKEAAEKNSNPETLTATIS